MQPARETKKREQRSSMLTVSQTGSCNWMSKMCVKAVADWPVLQLQPFHFKYVKGAKNTSVVASC